MGALVTSTALGGCGFTRCSPSELCFVYFGDAAVVGDSLVWGFRRDHFS